MLEPETKIAAAEGDYEIVMEQVADLIRDWAISTSFTTDEDEAVRWIMAKQFCEIVRGKGQ